MSSPTKPRGGASPNPLVTAPDIHPKLQQTFDALVEVATASSALMTCYSEMLEHKELCGLPKPNEWPRSAELVARREQHRKAQESLRQEYEQSGESGMICDFVEPRWTELIREWGDGYIRWCKAINDANQLVKTRQVSGIMDLGVRELSKRWTNRTAKLLDTLAGCIHPIRHAGIDGTRLIQNGLPSIPADFSKSLSLLLRRLQEIRAVPESVCMESNIQPPQQVVLWEGAEVSEFNIKLARVRTAYLEANGNVKLALKSLKNDGLSISKSTFYNHLNTLDERDPGWRHRTPDSNRLGNREFPESSRTLGKR